MKRFLFVLFTICVLTNFAQAQVGVMRSSNVYSVQKTAQQDLGPLTRDGNYYYYHGKSMTEKEMVAFIQKDCERAYNYYKRNHMIEKIGWAMFGAGFGIAAIGGGIWVGAYLAPKNESNHWTLEMLEEIGMGIIGAGAGVVGGVGIPMICVGAVRKKNAHKIYNAYCASEETAGLLEFNITSGANGLGLALSF